MWILCGYCVGIVKTRNQCVVAILRLVPRAQLKRSLMDHVAYVLIDWRMLSDLVLILVWPTRPQLKGNR